MYHKKKIADLINYISPVVIAWLICLQSYGQCASKQQFWNEVINIESSSADAAQKLSQVSLLVKQFDKCGFEKDSVYARMLHRMAAFQYQNGMFKDALENNFAAIKINRSGRRNACRWYVAFTYYNTGACYEGLSMNNQALAYYDSVIAETKTYPQAKKFIPVIRSRRGNIFYRRGDFEKNVEETTLGLQTAAELEDSAWIIGLLLERAQAYERQSKINEGLSDVNKALALLKLYEDDNSYANAYRYKADLLASQKNFSEALGLYKKAIAYRLKIDNMQASTDYNDAGYMLMYKLGKPAEAKNYFLKAQSLANKTGNKKTLALSYNNLAQLSFREKKYEEALNGYQQSINALLPKYNTANFAVNPSYNDLLALESKSFAEVLLDNKSACLLYLFKQNNKKTFLKAALATALLADSLITDLRHEQTGEQTKLYWRNDTRDFFTRSLEACYLDNNSKLAFYFMEKSRAVLLNDKLNELGAAVHLPAYENQKMHELLDNITAQQQKISELDEAANNYAAEQNNLLQAKENFEHYIQSLEQKYPAYYQYKYADEAVSLQQLQHYISKNKQSFVHYFMGDTVTYILAITTSDVKFTRLSQTVFNKQQPEDFLKLCADKQALNNNYNVFAELSNSMYKKIFQPLQLPKGRVVICADNIVIPFDALCADEGGKNFLLNDYSFSYVYSAWFLMKQFSNAAASGNFLGFAPVSFSKYLGVSDLKNAAGALHASSAFYNNEKLFTNQTATRNNFFKYAAGYSIVNIFSHARAGANDKEPVLYMQDSVIHLSELMLLNNPATKLVLLSACQTNVGKAATGEGIYSLARGFATAGIPSVAATLWKADEQTIYRISEKFNEYLSEGMNKDEALQKAKQFFIQANTGEKMLPYFWANMIVIGNTDALNLTNNQTSYWWWVACGIVLITIAFFTFKRKRKLHS